MRHQMYFQSTYEWSKINMYYLIKRPHRLLRPAYRSPELGEFFQRCGASSVLVENIHIYVMTE